MSDEVFYAVDHITKARAWRRGKRQRAIFQYCVRWKGYSPEDDTWEPKESFEGGSEHFIEEFWSREIKGLNGRDPNQTFQFRHGEELVAVGPLVRKRGDEESSDDEDEDASEAAGPSNHRTRDQSPHLPSSSSARTRTTRRDQRPPPSEDEEDSDNEPLSRSNHHRPTTSTSRNKHRSSASDEEEVEALIRPRSPPQASISAPVRSTSSPKKKRRKPGPGRDSQLIPEDDEGEPVATAPIPSKHKTKTSKKPKHRKPSSESDDEPMPSISHSRKRRAADDEKASSKRPTAKRRKLKAAPRPPTDDGSSSDIQIVSAPIPRRTKPRKPSPKPEIVEQAPAPSPQPYQPPHHLFGTPTMLTDTNDWSHGQQGISQPSGDWSFSLDPGPIEPEPAHDYHSQSSTPNFDSFFPRSQHTPALTISSGTSTPSAPQPHRPPASTNPGFSSQTNAGSSSQTNAGSSNRPHAGSAGHSQPSSSAAPPEKPIPFHRQRAANPRVRLMDDFASTQATGIAAKAKFMSATMLTPAKPTSLTTPPIASATPPISSATPPISAKPTPSATRPVSSATRPNLSATPPIATTPNSALMSPRPTGVTSTKMGATLVKARAPLPKRQPKGALLVYDKKKQVLRANRSPSAFGFGSPTLLDQQPGMGQQQQQPALVEQQQQSAMEVEKVNEVGHEPSSATNGDERLANVQANAPKREDGVASGTDTVMDVKDDAADGGSQQEDTNGELDAHDLFGESTADLFGGDETDLFGDGIPGLRPDSPPPSGEDLLRLAAGKPIAEEALEDYEEPAQESPADVPKPAESTVAAQAKESMLPSTPATAGPNVPTWRGSTIFGPLYNPVEPTSATPPNDTSEQSKFALKLSPDRWVPLVLVGSVPVPDAPSLSFVVGNYNPGGLVPGKFYGANVMHSLLDSVRSTGPAARALCSPTASIDQRADFEALKERLRAGELFIVTAGVQVLAFCHSRNEGAVARLHLPPALQGQPDEVLMSRVVIENFAAYAEVAEKATTM
ncbi:hypothetical protein FB107DRAFT_268955 [Schizophyllum commune]